MSGSSRQTLQRWVLGLLWSLKPPRLYGVPATLLMLARHYTGLGPAPGTLPDPAQALRFPDGLAGICTDMSEAGPLDRRAATRPVALGAEGRLRPSSLDGAASFIVTS
jgi:hypothetical protein